MLDTQQKTKTYQTYIDGKWVDAASGKTFETLDPYTGETWALIPECDDTDVNRAVEAAYRAFETGSWPNMTPTMRGKKLRLIGDLIAKHSEHLAGIEVRDNGKLISEMVAQTRYMPEWFYYYGGLADKIQGAVVSVDRPEHFNYILREPVGVCAFITPWNSPLMLTSWKLAPALAAGCTVVIKPSEYTSASLLEFMRLVIAEADIPPGVVNVVTGYGAVAGEPLVKHPKVAKIAFTGGTATGARVNALAAQTFKKVSLELGGKSPNVVFDDCILEDAVSGAVAGIFAATGQTCIAGSRLLLQETIHDVFVEKLVAMAKQARLRRKWARSRHLHSTRKFSPISISRKPRAVRVCWAAAQPRRKRAVVAILLSPRSSPASTTRCASLRKKCSGLCSRSSSLRTRRTRSGSRTR